MAMIEVDRMRGKMPLFGIGIVLLLLLPRYSEASIVAVDSFNYRELYDDYELSFKGNMSGIVFTLSSFDVCFNITSPPDVVFKNHSHVFLLTDDELCNYEDKSRNAAAANYSALIIYIPEVSPDWVKKEKSITANRDNGYLAVYNITTLLISEDSGQRIIDHFLYTHDPGSRLIIIENRSHIVTMLLIYISITAVFCIVMFVFLIVKCIEHRIRLNRSRLSSRHLKHLTCVKFKSGDPYETCAICLEDYKEKDKLRILPCSHAYHCKCIDPWLTNSRRTCPVCKQTVHIPGLHEEEEEESDTDAETAPLIRVNRRSPPNHGTFTDTVATARSLSNADSGATTSRDVPSSIFYASCNEGDASEEHSARASTSVPEVLITGSSKPLLNDQDSTQTLVTADCVSIDRSSSSGSSSSLESVPGSDKKKKTYVV